jgi:AraC family transcriptional regulator, regulatory protein of adaptative response / DNA-3-methyladenine glycosylase II
MALDQDLCYRAFVARDRRFDGRFFTAVLSTGIYCRPVCPARRPARQNVRFFACAAAAELAGFRPCLRCRPETAPGSPAWTGTSATLARALRLIEDGALDRDGVTGLATRLGITDRWLRQLFDEQLGASPLAVARTRRIHFARRLLDETSLPLEDVAQAAGFGSARRLRGAIQATFRRPPSALRGRAAPVPPAGLVLRLPARPPFDAAPLFRFLGARAVPGVETLERGVYRRSAVVDGEAGIVEVRHTPGAAALDVLWSGGSARGLLDLAARVSRLFDLRADVATIGAQLRRDPVLARAWPAHGVRVPGAWEPFEIAVRALLGQQVSVAAARTLAGRLVARCGTPLGRAAAGGITHRFPTAAQVAAADLDRLGITTARATALRTLAAAVASGALDLATPRALDEAVAALTRLPGVGAWTAQYIAMRALGEPDAFPAGDLGVRRALAAGGRLPRERDVLARAESWRPWRAYAAVALWTGPSGAPRRRSPRPAPPSSPEPSRRPR